MPDRAPGHGSTVTRRPDGPLRRRTTESVPAGRPLARQRLLTALSQAVDRAPVMLLSGPTGSGKTVLAASWALRAAASTGGPPAQPASRRVTSRWRAGTQECRTHLWGTVQVSS